MSKEKGYEGWKSYETWLVALWLGNEEGTYNLMQEFADEETETCRLGDRIKDFIEEYNPCEESGLYTDLLNAAISEVDFYEIAEHYMDEKAERNKKKV